MAPGRAAVVVRRAHHGRRALYHRPGKTRLAPDPGPFQSDLGKALWSVSKDLYKEAKKRERDAAAAERDAERRARRQAKRRINKAQACYEVMERPTPTPPATSRCPPRHATSTTL